MRAWGPLALRWEWRWSARACGESGGGDGGKSPTGTRVLVVIGISDQEMVGHTQLRNCQTSLIKSPLGPYIRLS